MPYQLVDSRKFAFIVAPKLQDWYNQVITPHSYKAELRKTTFLIPEELISQLSVEQIFGDQTEV